VSSISQKEAIYLFDNNEVCQGYWLSEFESLVRERAILGKFDQQKIKAAYVVIGPQNFAQAMVLFQLPINPRGFVESSWFLPLRRLADSASHGPNMGDGRIRLTCQSQCSISWHTQAMWEPLTSDFMAIRKAIRDDLMGQKPLSLEDKSDQILLKNFTVGGGVANAMSKRHSDPEVEQLKSALKTETIAYRNQLQQLQGEIERQKAITEKAQRQVGDEALAQELDEIRQLHRQEVGNVVVMKKRLERLQAALITAESHSIESFISRIDALESVLVSFHPGAGHLTISAKNMRAYAENPRAYAAEKCHVSETHYNEWLDHYNDPKCQQCRCEVPLIESPQDYQQQLQGYCELHRSMTGCLE
jgi:hypothetical protein